jgi:hypothetical protein
MKHPRVYQMTALWWRFLQFQRNFAGDTTSSASLASPQRELETRSKGNVESRVFLLRFFFFRFIISFKEFGKGKKGIETGVSSLDSTG